MAIARNRRSGTTRGGRVRASTVFSSPVDRVEDIAMAQREHPHQPPQEQERQPGIESEMTPRPQAEDRTYRGSGKLSERVALISGGDSGIGRAVAIAFAKEGADVAIVYLNEHDDAQETKRQVEQEKRRCILMAGDIGDERFCQQAVRRTIDELG